jgi:hypothetical protein
MLFVRRNFSTLLHWISSKNTLHTQATVDQTAGGAEGVLAKMNLAIHSPEIRQVLLDPINQCLQSIRIGLVCERIGLAIEQRAGGNFGEL